MVQQMQMHTENQGQKSNDHLNRCTKSLWKNWTHLQEKNLKKIGTAGTWYSITKAVYSKSKANGILNGEKSTEFPLK